MNDYDFPKEYVIESADYGDAKKLLEACNAIPDHPKMWIATQLFRGQATHMLFRGTVQQLRSSFGYDTAQVPAEKKSIGGADRTVLVGFAPIETVCGAAAAVELRQRDSDIAKLKLDLATATTQAAKVENLKKQNEALSSKVKILSDSLLAIRQVALGETVPPDVLKAIFAAIPWAADDK